MPQLLRNTHKELMKLYKSGEIEPLIYNSLPFEEPPDGLELLGDRGTYGKLVTLP